MTEVPKRLFVLFGLHRSGSSATAGIIHFLGADMGQNEGLFENLDFVLINDEILWSHGSAWDNPPAQGKLSPTIYLTQRMEHFLSTHKEPVWGLKDPRLLLTFQLWESFLKVRKEVTYVFIHRPFVSSVKSLSFRDNLSLMQSVEILGPYLDNFYHFRYRLEAQRADILDVYYNELVSNPTSFVKQVNQRLGASPEQNLDKVQAWIDASYKRF
jgi:hypothetical protein